MAKKRDYKAEYIKRIERAIARGFSRSQARGHPRTGEQLISKKATASSYDRRLEEGLRSVRRGKSLSSAAKSIHASPKTLKKYIEQSVPIQKRGQVLSIGTDRRVRELPIFSAGREQVIKVRGFNTASEVGRYMARVRHFLETNDPSLLRPFEGRSVVDVNGQRHVFETRPNVLYRLNASKTE